MKAKIKQAFSMAALTYDHVAHLQRDAGSRLLLKTIPHTVEGTVVDLGCGTGFLTLQLLSCHAGQRRHIIALDLAQSMLRQTRSKCHSLTRFDDDVHYLCGDAESLPLQNGQIDWVLSNLALQWCMPLNQALSNIANALRSNGRLVFSTFGAQTLKELKFAWSAVDDKPHVNDFYDQQTLSLLIEHCGFEAITIERVLYESRYDSVQCLLRELKTLGAHSVLHRNSQPITTRGKLNQMIHAYPQTQDQIIASFEVFIIEARKR